MRGVRYVDIFLGCISIIVQKIKRGCYISFHEMVSIFILYDRILILYMFIFSSLYLIEFNFIEIKGNLIWETLRHHCQSHPSRRRCFTWLIQKKMGTHSLFSLPSLSFCVLAGTPIDTWFDHVKKTINRWN